MKWATKALLLKMETVYGTDSVPTGAANAVLAFDVELTPIAHEAVEREPARPYFGTDVSIVAGEHVALSFSVELTPGGAVDAPPAWGPVARACGFAETITVTTGPVEYDLVSDGEESVSIYMHIAGTLHKILGFRGKASQEWVQGQPPRMKVEGMGLIEPAAAAALPVADYAAWPKGRDVSKVNTPTFTLHGFAAILQSLTIDLGQEVAFRPRVNNDSVEITNRKAGGSVAIDAPALATKDFFAISRTDPPTLGALQLIHGAGAGNIVQIDAPSVQVLPPSYTNSDGIVGLEMGLGLKPVSGDDEFKITTK